MWPHGWAIWRFTQASYTLSSSRAPLLFVGLAGILLLVPFFSRRCEISRPIALLLILCSLSPLLAYCVAGRCRTFAFQGLAYRAQPLVEAIEAYRYDKGNYPERLEELVPHYLERVPRTGMAAYRHFHYERRRGDQKAGSCDSYELQVPCGELLGFDLFVYWPEGDYPEYLYCGWVETIGAWGYVHE